MIKCERIKLPDIVGVSQDCFNVFVESQTNCLWTSGLFVRFRFGL